MGKFGFLDRFRIPSYDDPEQMEFGIVEIDLEKCSGCGLCEGACPANALVIAGKHLRMRKAPENACAFCGDCAAICPAGAISMKSPYAFSGFYKTIDRGQQALHGSDAAITAIYKNHPPCVVLWRVFK